MEALQHLDVTKTPVIDKLIKNMPDVCEYVLDKSVVKSSHNIRDPNFEIKYDFAVLDSNPDQVEDSTYFGPGMSELMPP